MPRVLYTYFRSSTSFRLRIALALKGLDYESRFVNLRDGEQRHGAYLAMNPQGNVPALIDEGRTLTQSMALIEYLDEKYPEPRLMPDDPVEREYVRALSQIIGCEMHPLNNTRVLKYLENRWNFSEDARAEWYRHWIAEGFRAFEAVLSLEKRHGDYCLGNRVTMADICLAPQVFNARRFDCPMQPYPILVAIHERLMQLPAFERAQPKHQPDAV